MSHHGNHIVNHIRHPELINDSTLHVIGVISNPVRYHSRYRLFREWEKAMLLTKNVRLHIVESAFGDRHHEVTSDLNREHLQVRTNSEIWLKENMINLGVRHLLPRDWRYMAWVDCDVFFDNPSWALETIHQLQHFPVVQPWQDCLDLGPAGNVYQHFRSFGFQHQRGVPKQKWPGETYYQYAHSGFAWACTRQFWENTGGLIDFAILGSADHHMAFGMIGEIRDTIHKKMDASFFRRCYEWQDRAVAITKGQVGFVHGFMKHGFHGPKKRRQYRERWQILWEHGYSPDRDLVYDAQGVLHLVGKPDLEQDIRLYNRFRSEDSIDEE